MKFAIAIGILTASAAATVTATAAATSNQRKLQEQKDNVLSLLKGKKKQQQERGNGGGLLDKNKMKRATLLKNRNKVAEPIECDPAASQDPDVGILACGIGEYSCLESATSKLGGVCSVLGDQEERHLQDGNSFITTYCNYCDCEDFDIDSGNGTIACVYGNYCFDEYYPTPECSDLCVDLTLSYEFELNQMTGYTVCYNVLTPYERNICVTYGPYGEEYADYSARSCLSVMVDDTQCNSCEIETTTNEYCFDYDGAGFCFNTTFYGEGVTETTEYCSDYQATEFCFNETNSCRTFDCTNTVIASSGSGCYDNFIYYLVPALEACFNSSDSFTFRPSDTFPPTEEATATSGPAAVAAVADTTPPTSDPTPAPSVSPPTKSASKSTKKKKSNKK